MKTALISLLTATFLGLAYFTSGRPFDAADFTAIVFTTGLAAWTLSQYGREFRPLTRIRPMRLPVRPSAATAPIRASRMAA